MKRLAVFGLILLVGISFIACPGKPSGKVELTYSLWGTPDELAAMQKVCDTYNGMQDKVVITPELIPHDTYEAVLNTRATSGTLPDCGMLIEQSIQPFAAAGLLADASNMYPADNRPLDSLAFKGPNGNVVAYSAANEILLLYYNKDMFDNAGVAYPPANAANAWTWDQFVQNAKLLTLDANGRNATQAGFDSNNIRQYGAMVENLTWQLEVWCLSNGSGFYNDNGSQVTIDNPAAIEAIQKVADLHLKDFVAPLSTGLSDDGVQRSLIAGNVAMTTNGQWNVGTSLSTARDEQGLNYGVAVLPYMKEKVTINTGGATVVFKGKNEEAAMEFVRWYASEENNWWLIELGIWMPTKEKWYTDESLTRKWVNNPAFPPYDEYKSAVVDYAMKYGKPTAWYYTPNTNEFNALLQSILGNVWTGQATAQQVITGNIDALKRAHAGN